MKKLTTSFFLSLLVVFSSKAQTPGNSLHFDGSNDYVSAALPSVFNNISSNDFTVETWVKPMGSGTQRIFFAQLNASNFVSILLNTADLPYIYIYGPSTIGLAGSNPLPISQWSHIAVTWNAATQQATMYVNGIQETLIAGGGSSSGTNGLMTLGSRTDGMQNLNGELDEFRIWNYVRTVCQIQAGMNSEYTPPQVGLVAYYKFNEGVAGAANTGITTLPDLVGSHDGTLLNFNLNGSTSNWVNSSAIINSIDQIGGGFSVNVVDAICMGDSYVLGTQTLTSAGTYTEVFTATNGCDSTVTLDLTVNNPASGTDVISACGDYIWIDGNTYTTNNNTATHVIGGGAVNGCDSVVALDLTINTIDLTVSQFGITLTANESGALYQWVDCDNGNMPIAGETNQSYTPISNGNYAVEISANGCTEISNCTSITTVGLYENEQIGFDVHPNPANGMYFVSINLPGVLEVYSANGQLISSERVVTSKIAKDVNHLTTGVYTIRLVTEQGVAVKRLVVNK
jgi:hypothetical protein